MEVAELETLRYPIGKFTYPKGFSEAEVENQIKTLENLPGQLRKAVEGLSKEQLDTPYREGGWTVRQVVHHIPDSHFNAYIRFKLALTEDNPTIKPYFEKKWAELPDKDVPIEPSVDLLEALHKKWVYLIRHLTHEDLNRTFFHPEHKKSRTLYETLALYDWHSRHHLGHITELKKRKGW
jgi:hypothetical protein